MKISGNWIECELSFSPPDNEGWMRSNIQIKVASFEGSYACTVEKEEWKYFIHVLEDLESSIGEDAKASWGNMEENIEFKFTLSQNGHLEVDYRFSPENYSLGPTLSGTFEADQTYLKSWITSAKQVIEVFR